MSTHAEQILVEQTPSIEPALCTEQRQSEHKVRVHRRRRRSKSAVTPGRVLKFVSLGVLTLVTLVILTAEFLRSAQQKDRANAEQERACAKAYKNGDVKLAEVACAPDS